jgi:hypothetical protein
LEICCRHPDWKDVPLETYVEIENPPAECEEDFYDSDDYNYEYEDSTCIKVNHMWQLCAAMMSWVDYLLKDTNCGT